ncbi:MAG: adenosylhomocysteinase [Candidatus Hadarchaeum yellowstonense]|uniref:Adenosylhomocysteinase n=1 Tax=Hadarchaeum yellowstonense TaxID=1776334 RepID=A0A147JSD6_HADYE|nr:MAG: adenosylhomocysteinase [Candidatus Hadarchaeum yellowstonense]
MNYKVKDIRLAAQGKRMMEWAERHMPVLAEIRRELAETKPLRGVTVGAALHTEAKTGVLVRTLVAGGARVAITSCNPLSTRDEVAAALAKEGVHVYAWRGESTKDYYSNLNAVLETKPQILIDDGADLITAVHTQRRELLSTIIGASEETTTGVNRLRAMEKEGALSFPVIAVNDSPSKRFFDNRFGTAESTFQAITGMTNTLIAGKRLVVVGYGFVGRGIASRAKGLGAVVTVVETDPIKALEAAMDGFMVASMSEAARWGELFITTTGSFKVIRAEHIRLMKDGAILCNSGHFNVEIDLEGLNRLAVSRREIVDDVQEFRLKNGRRVYLLAEGRLVNLAGKRSLGHPMEIMDMSFALQALSVVHLVRVGRNLAPGVYEVPPEIDRMVAELKLRSMGIKIERPTKEQIEYSASWTFGT